MAYRRLSDGGEGIDEHDRSIIETCLDLESDMGLLEQRVTSSSTTDASARLTELVSMLSGAAAATGSVEGRLLPGEGEAHSREQLLEDQSGSEHEGGGPVGLHTSSMQALEERGEFISGVLPSLDPDSWMDAIPSIQSQPEDEEIRESSWIPGDEGEAELASTSLLSKDGHTEDPGNQYVPGDIRTHPYVRLPVLEKRVFPRYIRVSNLFVRRSWRFSPNSCLLTLRHLFAKETLNQKDADMVMNAVERLVTICWLRSSRPPRRLNPLCVVELLGYYFMAFDAIVCAIELFKDSMLLYRWWDKFTARFHLDLPATPPWVSFTPLAAYNRELILRLIRALKIYRTGKRPPLAEVVALKRLLFCSPHGRHRLKGPKWDPWRKDGMCP
ncbi:hypothetical protein EMWEY_00022230 [Eimeria maxima]|uniref:Uncharacterized protein n=1 Tax=Eimeria maxima TaxID=5804 RepID=U6M8Q1_EIMMA|nr:hypothetical protein EMWEY_00022230 [Eimeria maxima]CDJ59453.1 hypothetical protein EMWEY_00022230 [Eimeria maxima]